MLSEQQIRALFDCARPGDLAQVADLLESLARIARAGDALICAVRTAQCDISSPVAHNLRVARGGLCDLFVEEADELDGGCTSICSPMRKRER